MLPRTMGASGDGAGDGLLRDQPEGWKGSISQAVELLEKMFDPATAAHGRPHYTIGLLVDGHAVKMSEVNQNLLRVDKPTHGDQSPDHEELSLSVPSLSFQAHRFVAC